MGRWVGGAHRIPAAGAEREPDHTTACGGIDSPVERAYAVDERRDTPADVAHGKVQIFAVCHDFCTQQRLAHLPCAMVLEHGKGARTNFFV